MAIALNREKNLRKLLPHEHIYLGSLQFLSGIFYSFQCVTFAHILSKFSPIFYVSDTILSGSFLVETGDGKRRWGLLRAIRGLSESPEQRCPAATVHSEQGLWLSPQSRTTRKAQTALEHRSYGERGSIKYSRELLTDLERSRKRLTQVLNDGNKEFLLWRK